MGNKGCWQSERKEGGGDRIDSGREGERERGEIEIGERGVATKLYNINNKCLKKRPNYRSMKLNNKKFHTI